MTVEQEIISLTQQLLESIQTSDWQTYTALCDPSLTCFEPEARGQLVTGLEFHRFYFEPRPTGTRTNFTIWEPMVHLLGNDAAAICYKKIVQLQHDSGEPRSESYEETRIWRRKGDGWRLIHMHRSRQS